VPVEYDGVQHWENRYQRSWDIERIALLEAAGRAVVRISGAPA
jgi:very-short-patch-repair endonuclease